MSAATPKKAATKKASGSVSNAMRAKRILRKARPTFRRQGSQRKAEVKAAWRKPKGLHNKQKDNKKNRLRRPDNGYRTPESVRGMHISGLVIAHVANVSQLEGINAQTHGVVVAAVGAKKQLAILSECTKLGVRVLNHRADERIKLITANQEARVKDREAVRAAKAATANKKEKSAKKPVEEVLSEDEKKEQQEKIKEEVLTDKHQ